MSTTSTLPSGWTGTSTLTDLSRAISKAPGETQMPFLYTNIHHLLRIKRHSTPTHLINLGIASGVQGWSWFTKLSHLT